MKNILLTLLLFLNLSVQAQQLVQGIIKDNETQQPIQHALIIGNISGKSTVTNSEGRFQFHLPKEDSKLIIKHLDYFTQEISAKNKKSFQVHMQSSTESLEEIVILKTSIKSEIEKAIKTSQQSFSKNLKLNTFYRELLYINGTMYQYEDAEADYYLQSINKSNVVVKESRSVKFNNEEAKKFDSLSRVHYYWGDFKEIISHEFDFKLIKNIISDKEYNLYLTSKTAGDGTELYVLNFSPIENAKKATLSGTMIYGSNDYLIREIKANLADKFMSNNEFMQQNNHRFKRSFYNRTTIFKIFNSNYSLAYTSYRIFGVSEVLNQLTKVGGFMEILIDSTEQNPNLPAADAFYTREKLTPLGKNYKTRYWEKFNVVPLTYKEEQVLRLINK
ncbi:carboxypeptidase-like regulatory domain-containing protein [Flavobacterium sp. CBA20B-1]|uniref:carboxypeptidase-like regulatory domain-containing protein n=1 Tax=unclassified Flavobacterium TaxID=196869 RepID=UPI0022240EBF|nr:MULTISPECIES: carboxypeptidase-like regulatory domain-containing protein [unclassified Flavobacterium]WCM42011.1 carboxypeptidase-like regulatory domain-containing protein [Flavobacterium sp. CBA20B-1]